MKKLLSIIFMVLMSLSSYAQYSKLGDINRDNQVNITDITTLVDIVLHGYSPFSVFPTEVNMHVGGTANVAIEGGYYYYEVESANPEIVTITLNGMSATLTAVAGGETFVTVKDLLTFRTIDIPVVVDYKSLQMSAYNLSLLVGGQGTVDINSGSGYYSVQSSDENVATATLSGNTVIVTAGDAGNATITIVDIKTDYTATVEVTVYNPISLSLSSLNMSIGDEKSVNITSGSGNYSIQSSDDNVVVATIEGNSVKVTAVGDGTATVTVTDIKSGQTVSIAIRVNVGTTTCPDDHHPHMIDLGLPSGTKWACCNVGAVIPEGYGGYYAYGETEEKEVYDLYNYQFMVYDDEGYIDFQPPSPLGLDNDVASVKWGGKWRMPTFGQIGELLDNCDYEWGAIDGVNGAKFTSKTNGGSIFMPAAGEREGMELLGLGNFGNYWFAGVCNQADESAYFDISRGGTGWPWNDDMRPEVWAYGYSVRPVAHDSYSIPLRLSTTNLVLYLGEQEQGKVDIISGYGDYMVESSNDDIATAEIVNMSVMITAISVGYATVTVTDKESGKKVDVAVTVVTDGVGPFLTCPDDNHPHLIDLGLPSGTKWACCNVGANAPHESGGYYAWGETQEKNIYNPVTYQYCTGEDEDGDGYYDDYHSNTNTYGLYQNLGSDIAGTQYDVAYVRWGGSWVMPSEEQQDELLNNCTYEWTMENGVYGRKLTSKTNGGSIFLPAAGERSDNGLNSCAGSQGEYWSSTPMPSYMDEACNFYFGSYYTYSESNPRFIGKSVRPVVRNYMPLTLFVSSLKLNVGEESSVVITFGSGSYSIENSNVGVATASLYGTSITVVALGAGTTTITVTDSRSGETATIEVIVKPQPYLTCPDSNHPHLIDLGLPSGTKWACCNVGADKPEAYGGYYAWGETEEKSIYNDVNYLYASGVDDDGDGWYDDRYDDGVWQNLGSDIAGTQFDVAHMKWGAPWVMPSEKQQLELMNNCSYEWTTVNGVNGGKFTSKTNGGSIFLPAAGGPCGEYWASEPGPSYVCSTYFLFFDREYTDVLDNDRCYGLPVRPVSK